MFRAAHYYDRRRPGLGDEFLDEIAFVVGRIKDKPLAIAPFENGMRARLLGRFPYAIVYRAGSGFAFIVAVAHNARRPGYWRRRRPEME